MSEVQDNLQEHIDSLPNVEELTDAARSDIDLQGQMVLEQTIAYVKDVANKMCKNVEYGDTSWNEVWSVATISLYNILLSLEGIIGGLNNDTIGAITLEFFLIGTNGKAEDIEHLFE